MANSQALDSYLMASEEMRETFFSVKVAAKTLLINYLLLDNDPAEAELQRQSEPAFQKALNGTFRDSKTIPVQPDYLIAANAAWVWLLAFYSICQHIGFDLTKFFPECPVPIPEPPMFNGAVPPSPEHEALIQEGKVREAKAAQEAARRTKDAQIMARLAAQSSSGAGRGTQSGRGGRTVRGGPTGRGSDAGRGAPVPAPSARPDDNPRSNQVVADEGTQVAIKQEDHADMWQAPQARGNGKEVASADETKMDAEAPAGKSEASRKRRRLD